MTEEKKKEKSDDEDTVGKGTKIRARESSDGEIDNYLDNPHPNELKNFKLLSE